MTVKKENIIFRSKAPKVKVETKPEVKPKEIRRGAGDVRHSRKMV